MRFIASLSLLLSLSLLASCHAYVGYRGQYGMNSYSQKSATIPPIQVPAGIQSPVSDQRYTIPWVVKAQANPNMSLTPPDPNFQAYLIEHHKKIRSL